MAAKGNRTLGVKVTAETKGASGIKDLAGQFTNLDKIATGASERIGHKVTDLAVGGLQRGAEALTEFIGGSIEAASQLQQATGAVESVFGEVGGAVEKFAETSAESFGLSQRQVKEFGSLLGAQLQSFGFEAGEAAAQTVDLEKRAADMAATFGGTVPDAVQAISSLMRGERNPIEKYGVSLKQADVNARILALGLDTSTTEAEKQATAIASLDLLYEQTSKTQGQFARESAALAGQQARWNAQLEDAQASIGEKLMPIAVKFFEFLNDVAVPALGLVADAIGFLVTPVGWLTDAIGFVGDFVGSVIGGTDQITEEQGRMLDEAGKTWEEYNNIISSASHGTQAAAEEIAQIPISVFEDKWDDARSAAYQMLVEYAKGLLDGQNKVKVNMEALTQLQEEEMTRTQEIAYLQGVLASDELASGLQDSRPGVNAQARATVASITARLAELGAEGYIAGQSIPTNIAAGMTNAQWKVTDSVQKLTREIRGYLPGSEPKNPNSPLRGITNAFGFMDVLAEGLRKTVPIVERALAGSLSAPTLAPIGAMAGGGGMSMAGAGVTVNLTVNGDLTSDREQGIVNSILRGWDLVRRVD